MLKREKQERGVVELVDSRVERVKYAVGAPAQGNWRACLTNIQFMDNRIYAVDGYRMSCDADPELTVPVPFMPFMG